MKPEPPKQFACPACGAHLNPGDPFVSTNDTLQRTYHHCPLAEDANTFVELQPTEQLAYDYH